MSARPPIDWRFVLANLHLNWPEDAIREATELRDANLRAANHRAAGCPECGQPLPEETRR